MSLVKGFVLTAWGVFASGGRFGLVRRQDQQYGELPARFVLGKQCVT